MTDQTISQAISAYLDSVAEARKEHTARTYTNALNVFSAVLKKRRLDPETTPAEKLTEDAVTWIASHLKVYASATERLYITAVAGFYKYLVAERLADINLPRLDLLIRQRTRKPGIRFPQFPADEIERLLSHISDSATIPVYTGDDSKSLRLREMRDRAFMLTLADTGLRVHEACALRRGDIDWNEGRAIIIGKGDKQAVIRFTSRSMTALKDYLALRSSLDGGFGRPLASLPLFARHDKGAGQKIKPITTTTGRNIVTDRVRQILGEESVGKITPHSFRHYFVTSILRVTGNLVKAQMLARHKNIETTKSYTHLADDELDKAYYEVFEKNRKKGSK
ncbi:MAG TPA: tyrosine-type recombinase/integrase [Anaerolineales bacterium]|nr:tyrosine-type recombinase/integrase [Anaerolineales bacterium]